MTDSQGQGRAKRQKVVVACEPCRARKVWCLHIFLIRPLGRCTYKANRPNVMVNLQVLSEQVAAGLLH